MAEENRTAAQKKAGEDPRTAVARERAAAMVKSGSAKPDQFFKETWAELKKTTWPNRETLVKSTYVVLAFIAFTAVSLGALDWILTTSIGEISKIH